MTWPLPAYSRGESVLEHYKTSSGEWDDDHILKFNATHNTHYSVSGFRSELTRLSRNARLPDKGFVDRRLDCYNSEFSPVTRSTQSSGSARDFRVVSYNVHAFMSTFRVERLNTYDSTVEFLKSSDADVICLQQYTPPFDPASRTASVDGIGYVHAIHNPTPYMYFRGNITLSNLASKHEPVVVSNSGLVTCTIHSICGMTVRIYNVFSTSDIDSLVKTLFGNFLIVGNYTMSEDLSAITTDTVVDLSKKDPDYYIIDGGECNIFCSLQFLAFFEVTRVSHADRCLSGGIARYVDFRLRDSIQFVDSVKEFGKQHKLQNIPQIEDDDAPSHVMSLLTFTQRPQPEIKTTVLPRGSFLGYSGTSESPSLVHRRYTLFQIPNFRDERSIRLVTTTRDLLLYDTSFDDNLWLLTAFNYYLTGNTPAGILVRKHSGCEVLLADNESVKFGALLQLPSGLMDRSMFLINMISEQSCLEFNSFFYEFLPLDCDLKDYPVMCSLVFLLRELEHEKSLEVYKSLEVCKTLAKSSNVVANKIKYYLCMKLVNKLITPEYVVSRESRDRVCSALKYFRK